MKKNKEEAIRWLKQAEYHLRTAESNFKSKFFSSCCFMCEQAAQVALKSFIIFITGRPPLLVHSIKKLAEFCSEYEKKFKDFIEYGKILDRYYLTTRYPDAIAPPAIPYEIYTRKDAKEALRLTKEIIKKVKEKIEGEK